MPLKNAKKRYIIDPKVLWASPILTRFKKEIRRDDTWEMILRVFREAVATQDEYKSAGYFEFGILVGHGSLKPKRDVDHLWKRLNTIFDLSDEAVNNHMKKCLGTVLMAITAEDGRYWYYLEDEEKKVKVDKFEIPDPNKYF